MQNTRICRCLLGSGVLTGLGKHVNTDVMLIVLDRLGVGKEEVWVAFNAPHDDIRQKDEYVRYAYRWPLGVGNFSLLESSY